MTGTVGAFLVGEMKLITCVVCLFDVILQYLSLGLIENALRASRYPRGGSVL